MSTPNPGWQLRNPLIYRFGAIKRVALHPVGNPAGVWHHELHAEIAEYRLRHDGIKPELRAYLDGIGRAFK